MMMRILLPLVLMCSSTGFAASSTAKVSEKEASMVISHAEFMHLTRPEQRTYIRKVRKMILAMHENDPLGAAKLLRNFPLLQEVIFISLPEAEAQTAPPAPTDQSTENLTQEEIRDTAQLSLAEAEKYRKALADSVKKKKLTADEKANLEFRYQNALSWVGTAGLYANALTDGLERNAFVAQSAQALEEAKKLKTDLLTRVPPADKASAEQNFDRALTTFAEPAVKAKFSLKDPANQYMMATIAFDERVAAEKAEAKKPKIKVQDNSKKTASKTAPVPPAGPAVPPPPGSTATVPPALPDGAKAPNVGVKDEAASSKKAGSSDAKKKGSADNKKETTTTKTKDEPGKDDDSSSPTEPAKTAGTTKELFRCMHSGFVIQGKLCLAPSSLPIEMPPLDKETFVCKGGNVMCNPMIFGFDSPGCKWTEASAANKLDDCWKKAVPLCVYPGRYATSACDKASKKNSDYVEAAIDLIAHNKEAWGKFRADFESLCDKENIDYASSKSKKRDVRDDVLSTCKIARKERDIILKEFGSKYFDSFDADDQKKLKEDGIGPRKKEGPQGIK